MFRFCFVPMKSGFVGLLGAVAASMTPNDGYRERQRNRQPAPPKPPRDRDKSGVRAVDATLSH
jgi:hypothetical protein